VLEDQPVQRHERRHALDDELVERAQHAQARTLAIAVPDAELGDQRVVEADDLVALLDPRVDAYARTRGLGVADDATGRRPEARTRVLGVDAALERVAAQRDVGLGDRQRRAAGDLDLPRTRSKPVTSSVTGCSTWMRVFISRKKNSPWRSSRHSTVPAPT